jgi:hypothetical protein
LRQKRADLFFGQFEAPAGRLGGHGDFVPVADEYFPALVDYVVARAETQDDESVDEGRAIAFFKLFGEQIAARGADGEDLGALVRRSAAGRAGVGQDVAKNAIRNAAIDFCSRSWVWRADHADINALAGIGAYAYAPPANTKVAVPLAVWYALKPIDPQSTYELQQRFPHWPSMVGQAPYWFLQETLETLVVVPAPSADLAGAIKLKVALTPTRAAPSIDDAIFERYLEEIACGAKARLFAMKAKPWSDPSRAIPTTPSSISTSPRPSSLPIRNFVRGAKRTKAHFF